MYKVVIFGTGAAATEVLNIIKKDECIIVSFLDNNSCRWGKYNNIDVKDPKEINTIEYDYIIIASQYNDEIYNQLISLGVDCGRILQFFKYINKRQNYVSELVNLFVDSKVENELIATGLSYCKNGLDISSLNVTGYNFAYNSQDLYYDYNIVKYILDNYREKCTKIKYCLIGLSYYSFQYDLSLSIMKDKVYVYYNVLGTFHNNPDIKEDDQQYAVSLIIADKLLDMSIAEEKKESSILRFQDNSIVKKQELGLNRVKSDCNKNYPLTVKENKQILKDYLELLIQNDIKPVVVVFPASRYYNMNFSIRIENEFNDIIKEFKSRYNFMYLDYFRSNLFKDEDFFDASHLNNRGAKKFTEILNGFIK